MTTEELERRLRDAGVPITPTGMLRERDAAEVLGCSPRTLREWRADGLPPAYVRLNSNIWYGCDDLAAFITAGKRRPAGE